MLAYQTAHGSVGSDVFQNGRDSCVCVVCATTLNHGNGAPCTRIKGPKKNESASTEASKKKVVLQIRRHGIFCGCWNVYQKNMQIQTEASQHPIYGPACCYMTLLSSPLYFSWLTFSWQKWMQHIIGCQLTGSRMVVG